MFISSLTYENKINPVFGTNTRAIKNGYKIVKCNTTWFFREDLNWKKFVKLLNSKYKDVSKINILDLACSDGSEPQSLMAALIRHGDSIINKVFPIIATDNDEVIISKAKSGKYSIMNDDLYRINDAVGHYSSYFFMVPSDEEGYQIALKPLDKYKECVKYNKESLFESIEKHLLPENNVILCRNVLPYLPVKDRLDFITKLSESLNSSDLVVIGALDNGWNIDSELKEHGFKESYQIENVYIKI